jgi:hypothetical protein
MKAVIYTLLFTLALSGICQHAHANTRSRKYIHHNSLRLIKEQFADSESLIGDEDEDDQNDFTRKYTVPAKWLSAIDRAMILTNTSPSNNKLSTAHFLSPPLGDIYITCRVLRI